MQEAGSVCGICGAHGGHDIDEMRDVRRTVGNRGGKSGRIRENCGAHEGHETAEVLDVQKTGGARAAWGQGKEWMLCFLVELRAFGIDTDQWTTAVQDKGEWRKTAEQGAERFMAKWIAAEKVRARLRHAVVYPNMMGKAKERIGQSKRTRAGSLAIVD